MNRVIKRRTGKKRQIVHRGGYRLPLSILLVFSVICLFCTFKWFQKELDKNVLATNYSFLEESANQQIITIQTKLNSQMNQLQLYSRSFENIDMNDYNAVKNILNSTEGFGDFKRISVATETGRVINNDNTMAENILQKDYFIDAMKGNASVSENANIDEDGEEVFIFSVPIYQQNEVIGVLMGTCNKSDLEEILSEKLFGGNGAFYIVGDNGKILLNNSKLKDLERHTSYFDFIESVQFEDGSSKEKVKDDFAAHRKNIIQYTIKLEKKVAVYQPIGIHNWYLVSVVNSRYITNQSKKISKHVFALVGCISAVFLALIAGIAFVYSKTIKIMKDNQEFKIRAETDLLTNLFNKKTIEAYINYSMEQCKVIPATYALYIIDIDNFKGVNDGYGHAFGDEVLKAVAKGIQQVFSKEDYSYEGRIGGDEFVVFFRASESVLEDKEEMIREKAEELCNAFRKTCYIDNQEYKISISVGVAIYPAHGSNYEELYKNADSALYVAKNQGKDMYKLYHHKLQKEGGAE